MKTQWQGDLSGGTFGREREAGPGAEVTEGGESFRLRDGAVVIAAITSCTNTSNPEVMLAAGLVARKARERGLRRVGHGPRPRGRGAGRRL